MLGGEGVGLSFFVSTVPSNSKPSQLAEAIGSSLKARIPRSHPETHPAPSRHTTTTTLLTDRQQRITATSTTRTTPALSTPGMPRPEEREKSVSTTAISFRIRPDPHTPLFVQSHG